MFDRRHKVRCHKWVVEIIWNETRFQERIHEENAAESCGQKKSLCFGAIHRDRLAGQKTEEASGPIQR